MTHGRGGMRRWKPVGNQTHAPLARVMPGRAGGKVARALASLWGNRRLLGDRVLCRVLSHVQALLEVVAVYLRHTEERRTG